jgi:DNA-binding SARP family transcriptional activator
MYLTTLGHPALHRGGPNGPVVLGPSKSLAVLAVLATLPEYTATRHRIAELLWPDMQHGKARRALRQALHYVVTCTGEHLVRADESDLRLDTTRLKVDLHEFEDALQGGDDCRVVDLYGGHFLAGLEGSGSQELEEWIESEDEYVRVGVEVACARLVSRLLEAGDAKAATVYARRHVELNPLDEAAQLSLIRALKAAGNLVGALQAYRSYRVLLKRALDDKPSAELERITAAVREELVS